MGKVSILMIHSSYLPSASLQLTPGHILTSPAHEEHTWSSHNPHVYFHLLRMVQDCISGSAETQTGHHHTRHFAPQMEHPSTPSLIWPQCLHE